MRLDTTLSQRMDQRMILAPRMIQSMEILQLPIMALQERIQQELQENPVLELKETANDESTAENDGETTAETEVTPAETETPAEATPENDPEFDRLEAFTRDWEDQINEEHRPSRNGLDDEGDKKHDAMQNMPSRPQSLQDYLNDQLTFIDTTPEQLRLLRFLITHVNEKGWLSASTEDITRSYNEHEDVVRLGRPTVTLAQVEEALRIVQKMDPPGVGARDSRECLLIQLTPETPHREILRVLIQNHLEDIAHNRLPIIQRRTGFDLATIKEAIEILKHLNPHPGAQFTA
ncbi:MAG TPA: RNA polymerase sigma-54 factor, partial [Gemmataceae bacterium]|nr:RNA polymerase sigma-54 factor [Gemmataceae bacterium]